MARPLLRSASRILCALLATALLSGALFSAAPGPDDAPAPHDRARCITALDGDTLLAEWPQGPSGRFRIRLLGVDCPERGQEFANAARRFSREFCAGALVELSYGPRRKDRYGRVLAYVWRNGAMLDEELVRAGLALAVAYDADEPHAQRLAAAERAAREARSGFWAAGGLRMTPRQYRRTHPRSR